MFQPILQFAVRRLQPPPGCPATLAALRAPGVEPPGPDGTNETMVVRYCREFPQVSRVMGVPQQWMVDFMENPMKIRMIFGGSPISGNTHIVFWTRFRGVEYLGMGIPDLYWILCWMFTIVCHRLSKYDFLRCEEMMIDGGDFIWFQEDDETPRIWEFIQQIARSSHQAFGDWKQASISLFGGFLQIYLEPKLVAGINTPIYIAAWTHSWPPQLVIVGIPQLTYRYRYI